MLAELVRYAEDHQHEMVPMGFRSMDPVRWALEVGEGEEPFRLVPQELPQPRPSINRSSAVEPLLIADTAEYVLGVARGSKDRSRHRKAFWDLLQEAEVETNEPALAGLSRAREWSPAQIPSDLKSTDVVMVRRKGYENPFEAPRVQEYWQQTLREKCVGEETGQCGVCGNEERLLRIMPVGVKGFPQDVKLLSFNLDAFESYGRRQGLNAPLCFECGTKASAALSHLLEAGRNRLTLVRDGGLANQVAIFWLKGSELVSAGERTFDLAAALKVFTTGFGPDDLVGPEVPADLQDVEQLVSVPWKGKEAGLRLDPAAFHFAILSANVSRLVVREWIQASLEELQTMMRQYLDATRIVDAWGKRGLPVPLRSLAENLTAYGIKDPKEAKGRRPWDVRGQPPPIMRTIVRCVYLGHPAPPVLINQAVHVLRKPNAWKHGRLVQSVLGAVRFTCIRNGVSDMANTEGLDPACTNPAYLCGRLLAVLERAQAYHQWKQTGKRPNASLVDRAYGAASTAPRNTFAPLLKTATISHLRRAGWLVPLLEEVMQKVPPDGMPRTLSMQEQADFAIGFHHQRAALRAAQPGADSQEEKE